MKYTHPISDLTAGELSPRMFARWETAIYQKGLSRCENLLPFPQGGVTLRGGTLHLDSTSSAAFTRLIPFIISSDKAYILELSPGSLVVRKNGLPVAGAYFTTPWNTEAVIRRISVAQIQNALVLVSSEASPRTLVWSGGDVFAGQGSSIPEFTFNGPGLAAGTSVAAWAASTAYEAGDIVRNGTEYYSAVQAGTSAAAPATGPSGQTATKDDPFVDGTVRWRWVHEIPFPGAGYYPSVVAQFQGRLVFAASSVFPARVWASMPFDYGNLFYFDLITYTNTQMRSPMSWFAYGTGSGSRITSGGGAPTANLEAGETYFVKRALGDRVYRVSSWDATGVNLMDALDSSDAASGMWLYSRWQDPESVEYEDVTIHRDMVNPGNGFMLELGSDQNDRILWMASGRALVIGTTTGEWILPPDIHAANISALLQTRYGSATIPGVLVNDSIVFVQSNRKRVRSYYYRNEQQAYESPELTFFADHILGPGAVALDFSQVPMATIWVLRSDGILAALLADKQSGAAAWSRIILGGGGLIESIAVVPDGTTGEDDLYLVVNRGGSRFIEKMTQPFGGFHVDAGVLVPTAAATVTGLARFTTADLVDKTAGVIYRNQAVTAGVLAVPVDAQGHEVHVGKLFTGYLSTLPLAPAPQLHGRPGRVVGVNLRVIESYPFTGGSDGSEPIPCTPDYSGDIAVPLPEGFDTRSIVHLQATGLPVTIIGILADVEEN